MTEHARVVTNKGGSVSIDEASMRSLGGALRGELLTPDHPAYEEGRRIWNGLIDKRPGLIVRCGDAADVVAAVNFARENDLLVAVRGGGHNVAGHAVCDGGVVVDLSPMRNVRVDRERRSVRVDGGATLGDLDRATHALGLGVPVGVVAATGIAGLTLHGGYGWLSRRHGLASDNLLSADVVTADGQLRRAGPDENPDLFWALRGGGGNFGVVTSFEFRLYPVGPKVWFAAPFYTLDKAEAGLRFFRGFMERAPEELAAIAVLWSAPTEPPFPEHARGVPVLIFLACYTGPFEEGERVVAPLREFDAPLADLSAPMNFLDVQGFFDHDYPDGRRYYWKSQYLPKFDDEAIRLAVRHAAERPSPLTSIDIWSLGGALARVAPDATAFAWRTAPFMYTLESNWDDPGETEANVAWTRKAFAEMKELAKGGAYLNFPGFGEEGEDLLKATYGANYSRLRKVKARYDPGNLFHGNFNIRP